VFGLYVNVVVLRRANKMQKTKILTKEDEKYFLQNRQSGFSIICFFFFFRSKRALFSHVSPIHSHFSKNFMQFLCNSSSNWSGVISTIQLSTA
jgi:hypothetical protein